MAVTESARGIVDGFLAAYGLQGLSSWAWGQYVTLGGGAEAMAQIELELPNQAPFQARFPAYQVLAKKGRAMSPAEMLAYERTATQMLRAAGLPPGFYDDPSDFAGWMAGEVSVGELQQRVQIAERRVSGYDPAAKQAAFDFYGLTEGDLVADALDPDRALPVLQRQAKAIDAGAAAGRAGIGLDRTIAEELADRNVEDLDAGFGQIAGAQGLFGSTVDEQAQGEASFGQAEQVGAVFGTHPAVQRRLRRRVESRQAAFAGSSGFGAAQGGVTGLGGE